MNFGDNFYFDDYYNNGAVFGDDTYFSDAIFGDNAFFMGVTFGNDTDFSYITFGNSTFFAGTIFGYNTNFDSAAFGINANFNGATFGDNVNFMEAAFGDNADFSRAAFGDNAHFGDSDNSGETTFEENASFHEVTFGDYTSFYRATFGGDADFSKVAFGDNAEFIGVNFNNTSNFNWANFADTVDFSDTRFKTISLNGTSFEEIRIEWDSLESSLIFDGSVYVKLIRNFRSLEQFEDADDAYYQYRKHREAEKSWIPFSKEGSKWCDILMWFTCGYGVRPFRAFYLGGLIVLLFSFIYLGSPVISWHNEEDADNDRWSIKLLLSLIPKIDWPNPGISRLTVAENSAQKMSFWDSFYFSMVTFSTIGYGDWYPKDNFRKWVMLEGLLGWLTLGLFLVTLTNVTIRP